MAVSSRRVREPLDVLETLRARHKIERRQVTDEQEALEAFAQRVRSVSIDAEDQRSVPSLSTRAAPGLVVVRDAYESTVMNVPHYEEEYGDTYAESVSTEFGPTVGVALTAGSQFGEQCRNALLLAIDRAIDERTRLLEAVEVERDSIAEVDTVLDPVVEDLDSIERDAFDAETFGGLDAYRARLAVLSERCDEAATGRQASIRDQRRDLRLPTEGPDVPTYLYRDLEADYPVLALIATLGDHIDRIRGELATEIATRR